MYLIYGKDNCTYCVQSEELLKSKGQSYKSFKIGEDITMEDFVLLFSERDLPRPRTAPQVFLQDENGVQYVGGFTQLKEMLDKTT